MKYLYLLLIALTTCRTFAQTFVCGDTLIDPRDGKKYATVLIGSDCWFKQNLNYGTYVQSDSLGIIHSQQSNNSIPEKYAQANDTNNLAIYGGLYEQAELMNHSTSPQGLCPSGWHVSTDAEWNNLIVTAGGTMVSSTAGHGGNALKAIGEGFGPGTGTDAVGISLKHGGDRDGFGIFYGLGLRAIYWTGTNSGPGQAYHYTFWAEADTIERLSLGVMTTAFSCRCVKDNPVDIKKEMEQGQIKIQPNPATNSFMVLNNKDSFSVDIIDTQGRKVISYHNLKPYDQVSIESINSGLYFVNINTNASSKIIKLIKQ